MGRMGRANVMEPIHEKKKLNRMTALQGSMSTLAVHAKRSESELSFVNQELDCE